MKLYRAITYVVLIFSILITPTSYRAQSSFSRRTQMLAFVSDRDGHHEIYVANLDSGKQQRLTFSEKGYQSMYPVWLNSSQIIYAYGPNPTDCYRLYIVNIDGSNRQRFAPQMDCAYDVSVDRQRKHIAFVAREPKDWCDNPCIYEADIDGIEVTNIKDIYGARDVGSPSYSPDGISIAFYRYEGMTDLSILKFNSDRSVSSIMRVTDSDFNYALNEHHHLDHFDVSPAWSPTKNVIAFVSTRTNPLVNYLCNPCLYFIDGNGKSTQPAALTFTNNQLSYNPDWQRLTWSSDGTELAFVTIDESGIGSIWATKFDGSQPYHLIDAPGNSIQPNWQPDAKTDQNIIEF